MSSPTADSHVDKKRRLASSKIPTCEEEMSAADREMHKMRTEGASWPDIVTKWKELTGETKATDSLSKRYNRMMTNFKVWPEEHAKALLEAKAEVEADMERTKWTAISNAVNAKVGAQYGMEATKKKYTQLEKSGVVNATTHSAPATPMAAAASSSATPKPTPTKTTTPKAKAPPKPRTTKQTLAKAKRSSIPEPPIYRSASEENDDDGQALEDLGTVSTKN